MGRSYQSSVASPGTNDETAGLDDIPSVHEAKAPAEGANTTEMDLTRTVLLTVDYQREWVELFATQNLLQTVSQVQDAARRAGIPVIHIRTVLSHSYLGGALPLTHFQRRLNAKGWAREQSSGAEFHPDVGPRPSELVITKQHEGPFVGTDLDQILRRLDAQYILVAGIPTSAAVRNIGTDGNNRFFNVILVSDCCRDGDPQVHRVLMDKVLNHQSQIATSTELLAVLSGAGP